MSKFTKYIQDNNLTILCKTYTQDAILFLVRSELDKNGKYTINIIKYLGD